MTRSPAEQRTAWLYAIHDSIVRDSPSTTELRRTMASGRAPAPAIEAYAAADAAADEHDSAPPAPSGRCHRGWLVKRGGFVKSWKRWVPRQSSPPPVSFSLRSSLALVFFLAGGTLWWTRPPARSAGTRRSATERKASGPRAASAWWAPRSSERCAPLSSRPAPSLRDRCSHAPLPTEGHHLPRPHRGPRPGRSRRLGERR